MSSKRPSTRSSRRVSPKARTSILTSIASTPGFLVSATATRPSVMVEANTPGEDGDGFCEVNTLEGFWSLLRSWLHRGISQEKLPLYLGFFQFVHNARRRGKALLGSLIEALVA